MAEILDSYKTDFDDLVTTVHKIHQGHPVHSDAGHINALARQLLEVRERHINDFSLSIADIRQELRVCWLDLFREWDLKRPSCSKRSFLLRRSVWHLRQWYRQQMRPISYVPAFFYDPIPAPEYGFELNLAFLLHGTDNFPLSELTPYERYLIFLKFKEEKTILEISDVVQKDRATVGRHMNKVFNKLRSLKDAKDNTR